MVLNISENLQSFSRPDPGNFWIPRRGNLIESKNVNNSGICQGVDHTILHECSAETVLFYSPKCYFFRSYTSQETKKTLKKV
jgi:hypothetical protein